jgi:hypothetical protein
MASYSGGFIDRYVENVLYPGRLTPYVQSLMALIVLTSWVVVFLHRRRLTVRETAERT